MRFSPSNIPALVGYLGNSRKIINSYGVKKTPKKTLKERAIQAGYQNDVTELYKSNVGSLCELNEQKSVVEDELKEIKDPQLKSKVIGILNMRHGTLNEAYMILLYPGIIDRSVRKCERLFGDYSISGLIDGTTMIGEEKYIVEFKTRITSEFTNKDGSNSVVIKMRERLQLLCYCNVLEVDHILFLEMKGGILRELVIKNFRQKYEKLWNDITSRLNLLAIYLMNKDTITCDISESLYWVD